MGSRVGVVALAFLAILIAGANASAQSAITGTVRDATGAVVGAVGVAGPSQRLSLDSIEKFAQPLLETVAAISTRLGYGAPYS